MPNHSFSPPPVDEHRRAALRLLALAGLAGTGFAGVMGFDAASAEAADAPGWPAAAFGKHNQPDALSALYGKPLAMSDKVAMTVPEIAENGAVVPISVSTTLPDVTAISVMVPNNPFTLAAAYVLPAGTLPQVDCRLKMAKTSNVVAIVESGGKLYGAVKQVKVTLGGCGG